MHPGNHKLLMLERQQEEHFGIPATPVQMDTADDSSTDNASDFQRVGEFAQMG